MTTRCERSKALISRSKLVLKEVLEELMVIGVAILVVCAIVAFVVWAAQFKEETASIGLWIAGVLGSLGLLDYVIKYV